MFKRGDNIQHPSFAGRAIFGVPDVLLFLGYLGAHVIASRRYGAGFWERACVFAWVSNSTLQ